MYVYKRSLPISYYTQSFIIWTGQEAFFFRIFKIFSKNPFYSLKILDFRWQIGYIVKEMRGLDA